MEPWLIESASTKLLDSLQEAHDQLGAIRRMLSVIVLCAQHLGPQELASWLSALFVDKTFRRFPALLLHLPPLFSQWPPAFRGCSLTEPCLDQRSTEQCLGPHCQCLCVSAASRSHAMDEHRRVASRLRRGDRHLDIRVPVWVAFGSATHDI